MTYIIGHINVGHGLFPCLYSPRYYNRQLDSVPPAAYPSNKKRKHVSDKGSGDAVHESSSPFSDDYCMSVSGEVEMDGLSKPKECKSAGDLLLSGSEDGCVYMWNLDSGRLADKLNCMDVSEVNREVDPSTTNANANGTYLHTPCLAYLIP